MNEKEELELLRAKEKTWKDFLFRMYDQLGCSLVGFSDEELRDECLKQAEELYMFLGCGGGLPWEAFHAHEKHQNDIWEILIERLNKATERAVKAEKKLKELGVSV